ncbi:Rid family hydrolase [Mucilaginibacter sp.]|uniref:RidA family protein n=1 Tax=Mucilaginibacter sp. TaxID=1882438 RepID=UPI0032642A17
MKFILLTLLAFCGVAANCQTALPIQPAYRAFVKSNGLLFVSGQIAPSENDVNAIPFSTEAESALKKIVEILKVNNLSASEVVSCTVYLTDIKYFGEFNTIYRKYFKSPYPSRTLVAVQQLVRQARIEISVIASLKKNEN